MKTFLTAAALVATLTFPAFAEGENPSTKAGEAKGSAKASTSSNAPDAEKGNKGSTMGGAMSAPRTTGAAPSDKPATNEKAGDTGAGEAGAKVK